MKGKAKWSIFLALVLVMSLFLSACNSDENTDGDTAGDSAKQVLNLASGEEIPTMNTTIGDDQVSFYVYNQVFEGLYVMNADNDIVPALATGDPEIKQEGDNFVYTYTLQPDAKWSNGDPVTANDFVYAWRQVLDKDVASTYSYLFPTLGILNAGEILNKDSDLYGQTDKLGVKAVDDHTLAVTLTKRVPFIKSLMQFPTFFPQDQKFKEAQGDKYALEADTLVYNGPFVLSSWEHNAGWTLKKNDTYWDKENVSLDQVNYKIVKELSTRVNLYATGQIDEVGLSGNFVQKYQDDPNFHKNLGTAVYWIKFNEGTNKFLKNVNIRKAISMAWDKKAFAENLLKDGSVPANFIVPKDFVKGPKGKDFRDVNGAFNEYDVAAAQALWQKGLDELGVTEVPLEFLAYQGEDTKDQAVYIKAQLEKNLPGISISINQQPFKVMLDKENNLKYDMAYAGWGPDYQDPMTFMDLWVTDGGNNQQGYSNPEFDAKIEFAKSNADKPQARWDAMLDAEKIFMEDAGVAPMFQNGAAYLLQPYVKGFTFHKFGPDYTLKYVSIEGK